MTAVFKTTLDCLSPHGVVLAQLQLVADGTSGPAPIVVLEEVEAARLSEAAVQLRENGHYEYGLETDGQHAGRYRLRCALTRRHLTCRDDEDRGRLDTGSYCGTLRLQIVDGEHGPVVATATAEVRSVKLGYREDFRAMLRDLEMRLAGLIVDLRAPVHTPYTISDAGNPTHLQQRIAFLCERLNAPECQAALQQITLRPHRQLTLQPRRQTVQRPVRSTHHLAQQWSSVAERIDLPAQHRLAQRLHGRGITSMPATITVHTTVDDVNTPENRFIRHALQHWRDFLQQAAQRLRDATDEHEGWISAAERAEQTARWVNRWLNHSLFDTVTPMQPLPIHSLVLQRQSGYHTIAEIYADFQTNAGLEWDASADLFWAGQRNVALLYEYWVFFQFLDWFCDRFDCRAEVSQQLFHESPNGLMLNLRHGYGIAVGAGARLAPTTTPTPALTTGCQAQLRYNPTYEAAAPIDGSWTRTMRPDITLSVWPKTLSLEEASAANRLTHLHFDAKYRVATLQEALGDTGTPSGAQRDDLLKMHAYRDAIRHTQGAYVIFPGSAADVAEQATTRRNLMFAGPGLLPSLGAFALVPSASGLAQGWPAVAAFLDNVIAEQLNLIFVNS